MLTTANSQGVGFHCVERENAGGGRGSARFTPKHTFYGACEKVDRLGPGVSRVQGNRGKTGATTAECPERGMTKEGEEGGSKLRVTGERGRKLEIWSQEIKKNNKRKM